MSTLPTNKVLLFNRDVNELDRWEQCLLDKEGAFEVRVSTLVTLEELQQIAPDLIVFGHTPTASDDACAEVLRSYIAVRPTKLLIVMAWTRLDDLERAVQFGADDVLASPFSPTEFIHRIDALLRG